MSNSKSARVSSRFTEAQVNELISELQTLLPDARSGLNSRAPSSKVLTDTCKYIKHLHKELDDLSGKLSQLLPSGEINGMDHEEIIRRLLQQ